MRLDLSILGRRRVPVMLQSEASECGLACLAMVASFHGRQTDLRSLRQRFSLSIKGITLKSLIGIAQRLGLRARPLKLDLQHLAQLKLPCVLHWDMNHFVVLTAVNAQHIHIHDPALGERRVAMAEVSQRFSGVALELMPDQGFVRLDERRKVSLRSLMGQVSGLGTGLGGLLVLGIALQVCALVAPFYLQWVVDEALVAGDANLLTVLGTGFVLLILLQTALGALRSWITTRLSTDLNFQWLGNAFGHLLRLPIEWFEKRHLGDIVSRFGSIQTIQSSVTTQFVEALVDGLLVLGTLAMMLLYSVQLASVAASAVLLYAIVRWLAFRPLRDAKAEQITHAAKQSTQLLESARGVQSIRLFGREEERRISWANTLADQFNAELRFARLSISVQTTHTLLFGLERVAVVWLAALAVMDTRFTVGMLFAFLSYKDQFTQRVSALIDKIFELRMLGLHAERVADILHTAPEKLAQADCYPSTPQLGRSAANQGEIELRDVSFRYADDEPWVLHKLNLRIPAGQFVAITGASGCGKTTLTKILLGLLEPTEGEVRVDGVRLNETTLAQHRARVGTVMQDDPLFSGSIADNIAFFDPSPDFERVAMCAQVAAIHDEILAMPMAYNTLIGDIGSGLSGGQRQRVLLARALYKQPSLLVLDEATSHLDAANEQRVNETVRQLALTRVVVAHRSETIAMAERVVVIEAGTLAHDLKIAPRNAASEPCDQRVTA